LLVLLLVAAGCGGSTVQKEVEAVDSVAAEGALLASDIARDRTTEPFARVHSGVLSEQADAAAKSLASRSAPPGARTRADAVAVALRRLHAHPTDRALAARLEQELERLAG
jgi:hypothetical protein